MMVALVSGAVGLVLGYMAAERKQHGALGNAEGDVGKV
jgi:hypothetical protein